MNSNDRRPPETIYDLGVFAYRAPMGILPAGVSLPGTPSG